MLILAVDTSTRVGSLAVLRDGEVLGCVESKSEEHYSSRLFQDLDRLLGELHLSLQQMDLFAVAAGPGSFTGLRVGLTAVKAWAEAGDKPAAAVSCLQAVAAQVTAPAGTTVAAVIDARRGQVFGGMYEQVPPPPGESGNVQWRKLGEDMVATADEFIAAVAAQVKDGAVLFASPTPDVLQPALSASPLANTRTKTVSSILAPVIGRLGHDMAQRGEVFNAPGITANYVRRTDAEVNWTKR